MRRCWGVNESRESVPYEGCATYGKESSSESSTTFFPAFFSAFF